MPVNERAWTDRCVPRVPFQASINYLTPEIIGKGLVTDVSRVGLRIESQDPVHIGMRLALVLYLSADQEPVMIEDATVQWATGTRFGVKFVKWSANAEDRLNNLFWTGIQEKCQSLLHLMKEAADASPLNEHRNLDAQSLEENQRDQILRALEECQWVIGGATGAAAKLGLRRTTLQYRMKRLGIARTGIERRAK